MSTQFVSNIPAKLRSFKLSKIDKVAKIRDLESNIILKTLQFHISKKVLFPDSKFGKEIYSLFKTYLE